MNMLYAPAGYHNYQIGHEPAWPSSTGHNNFIQRKLGNQTPGQIPQYFQDETPKYIRNLRQELNIAMRENLNLRVRLQQKDEEHESGLQLIELAESYSQQIKKSERTSQIDQVISKAFEQVD